MEIKETTRLIEEANYLIEQSDLKSDERKNLNRNIGEFMSLLSKDDYVAGCEWSWFDYAEDGHGLNLNWNWEDVKGVFGFYADNGHGFYFDFGEKGTSFWAGGEDGEHGFNCGLFLSDFEHELAIIGY